MTDKSTPRTDALIRAHLEPRRKWLWMGREDYREAAIRQVSALIEFARTLERELADCRAELEHAEKLLRGAKKDCTYDSEKDAESGIYGLSPNILIGITKWLNSRETKA